jgi:hypothetical protein
MHAYTVQYIEKKHFSPQFDRPTLYVIDHSVQLSRERGTVCTWSTHMALSLSIDALAPSIIRGE